MLTLEQLNAVSGKWKVIAYQAGYKCLCVCACGVERLVYYYDLRDGKSKQCRSCASSQPQYKLRTFPHPAGSTPRVRQQVLHAIGRCTNAEDSRHKDWGGRGIRVHSLWLERPELFVEYLMTLPGWNDISLVLDREDNEGHYEPGNLRFVTHSESQFNRRNSYAL